MKFFVCGTVLTTVFLGAFGFPADPKLVKNDEKQEKQSSLFGIGFDYNLSKNSTLIPIPSFLNINGNYENGAGAAGSFIAPMIFPLGLLYPPLNLSFGVNANKNVSFGVNAQPIVVENEGDAGWGWTTPAPSGWTTPGWTTTTPGWTTTTPGWTTTTPGWTTTTPGWTTTTPGWTTTTPGWAPPPGWKSPESEKLEKDLETRKAPGNVGPSKPVPTAAEKPKPQTFSKPNNPQIVENHPGMPDKGSESQSQSYIVDVAQSSVSSELPSLSEASQTDQALAAAATAQANAHHENELQSDSHPYFSIMEVDNSNVFIPEVPVSQDSIPLGDAVPAVAAGPMPAQPAIHNIPLNPHNVRISVPIAPLVSSKSRRHAGVEIPAALRIEDFEDVEVAHEPAIVENPVAQNAPQSEGEEEISKEEMILMAMEQLSTQLPPGMAMNIGRPAGSRPSVFNTANSQGQGSFQTVTVNKPVEAIAPTQVEHHEFSDSDFSEKEEDSSEESSEEESDSDTKKEPAPEPKPAPKPEPERPNKNKPRPYGMDRPSKNKPHSEGNKNEHFGLPHYNPDFQQKEQEGELVSTTLMGFQIPYMKWSSFSDIFQHFMGSRHRKTGMGKSDAAVVMAPAAEDNNKCVDDEEENDSVRTNVIHAGSLCTNNQKLVQCNDACKSKGFSSGTCLGPGGTPGCLCKLPHHKEYGMMLNPLKAEESRDHDDLQTSETPSCKKCECEDSCKKAGSFTGFCVGKCFCANPWYTKV